MGAAGAVHRPAQAARPYVIAAPAHLAGHHAVAARPGGNRQAADQIRAWSAEASGCSTIGARRHLYERMQRDRSTIHARVSASPPLMEAGGAGTAPAEEAGGTW